MVKKTEQRKDINEEKKDIFKTWADSYTAVSKMWEDSYIYHSTRFLDVHPHRPIPLVAH